VPDEIDEQCQVPVRERGHDSTSTERFEPCWHLGPRIKLASRPHERGATLV
jgi:hypothetical protein